MPAKLVCGVGINDVDYFVQRYETVGYVEGKRKKRVWVCPYYEKWQSMLTRCYSIKYKSKNPTYKNCYVCPDWFYLSNFIKWVDQQPNRDWKNCNLDKDILFEGNKCYSPSTCVFIDKKVNLFILDRGSDRGKFMLGVCWSKYEACYVAKCNDPFKTQSKHLGYFDSELEGHIAWKIKKYEYACKLADLQSDERVANALRTKYLIGKDFTCK